MKDYEDQESALAELWTGITVLSSDKLPEKFLKPAGVSIKTTHQWNKAQLGKIAAANSSMGAVAYS
jgi:hypothetical protein